MATIRSYTTVEQSRKLAEILPINSADMYWDYDVQKHKHYPMVMDDQFDDTCICAWSLAALLDILPKEINVLGTIYSINIQTKNKKWFIGYKCNNEEFVGVYSNIFVDACYEMILKLQEIKML